MTNHRRRDKESSAGSHRKRTDAPDRFDAGAKVTLARCCLERQNEDSRRFDSGLLDSPLSIQLANSQVAGTALRVRLT